MELLALLAILLLVAVGGVACKVFLSRVIAPEDRPYFAPAIGGGICGVVAYLAVHAREPVFISVFAIACVVLAIYWSPAFARESTAAPEAARLLRFSVTVLLCLYAMQVCLYHLYAVGYPGPHGVWTLFNLSGTPPPDQMFAWHQAMFADAHRHYPKDAFYGDMDLYDRPHLGGYITLFFFKLFHLPLKEKHFEYPAAALRFYQSLWWLLNDLYLLGLVPLFRRLFGARAAILAVSTTAVGGFFFLCSTGVWMKFASSYPLLLAFTLFLAGQGPILQGALCAMGYYIHGAVLPFLPGFGLLQIISVFAPLSGARRTPLRHVVKFAVTGCVLVGAWFLTVHAAGSKQPLVYYYIYDAGLTEAQTRPVAEIARDFYASHTTKQLLLLPLRNWGRSLLPIALFDRSSLPPPDELPSGFFAFADAIFAAHRTSISAILGCITFPLLFVALAKLLMRKNSGRAALTLYLIPTLFILLVYRKEWALALHIVVVYHAIALFLWAWLLKDARAPWLTAALAAIAAEGAVPALFATTRFLPAQPIDWSALRLPAVLSLCGYLALLAALVVFTHLELRRSPATAEAAAPPSLFLPLARNLAAALILTAAVLGSYALWLRLRAP
jgi:hypothetical protein